MSTEIDRMPWSPNYSSNGWFRHCAVPVCKSSYCSSTRLMIQKLWVSLYRSLVACRKWRSSEDFVCGLINPASLLSILLSEKMFLIGGKIFDNCRSVASHNAWILNGGFQSLYLLLCCIPGKRFRHFLRWLNWLIKSLHLEFAKPKLKTHFSAPRVLISDSLDLLVGLGAAHVTILCFLCKNCSRSEGFRTAVKSFCLTQQLADPKYHVPWSCHLLICLCGNLGADLHSSVWATVTAFNQHFQVSVLLFSRWTGFRVRLWSVLATGN